MTSRLIDLSTTIANRPNAPAPAIEHVDHAAACLERSVQIGVDPAGFPTPGIHFASEKLMGIGVHGTATHVDSPWHYGPETAGRPARTIEELPLDWFYGDAVVLDLSAKQDGGALTVEDVKEALGGHVLRPGEIVLLRTDLDRAVDPHRWQNVRELSREAASWILDQGVRVIGTDAISPDRSNVDELKAGRRERYYPAHHLGRDREFCIVELLTNLHLLPRVGSKVALFPIKIERGSGGWCRAVAFLEDGS